jgi:hypothetical protein
MAVERQVPEMVMGIDDGAGIGFRHTNLRMAGAAISPGRPSMIKHLAYALSSADGETGAA